MEQLKEKLINLENDFNNFKKNIERFHFTFIFVYFLPPLVVFFIYNRYLHEEPALYIKLIIISMIVLGVIIHFF